MKKLILRTAILTAVTAAGMLQSCTEPAASADNADATVKSAEDAAADAEAAITDANADEELQKLTDEIESELDG